MSRALRYSPPVPDRSLILRRRLMPQMHHRFDRAVTAVVAPAGFGKTTLLSQAVAENKLAPIGVDRWLTCQPADRALSFFAAGVFSALELTTSVPEDPAAAADAVTEALWGAAPRHVALILDDAQFVEADSPGGRFLASVIANLPHNGHIVLGVRPPLRLPLTRLLATGDALVLGEEDLQFRSDELAAFAETRGVPSEILSEIGGWPALAELTVSVGPHAATGYVWEELLSQFSPERRRALAVIAAVGGADPDLAAELLGRDVDLATLLSGLPLAVHARSGWRSLHPLWCAALKDQMDPARTADAQRTAGRSLARRRQYLDAMELLFDAGAWNDVRELITEVCETGTALVPPDVLALWQVRLPEPVRRSAEGLLLAAMMSEHADPATAERYLEQALAEADPDDPASMRVRYACLNALVQLAFWRSDRAKMQDLIERLVRLAAEGHRDASSWTALLTALLAGREDDIRAALAAPSLIAGTPLNPVQDWLHAHIVLRKLGDAHAAESIARRALAHRVSTMQAVSRCALAESLVLQGRLDEVRQLLPDLVGDLNPAKVLTSPELVTFGVVVHSVCGASRQAAELLSSFAPAMARSPVAWAGLAGPLAAAYHHVSIGEESRAVDDLEPVRHSRIAQKRVAILVSTTAPLLLYVLLPEVRTSWDAEVVPGDVAAVLQLARALVLLRERSSLDGVNALSATAVHIARAALPPTWTVELALGLIAAGRPEGRDLLDQLPSQSRGVLRRHAAAGPSVLSVTARAVLRETPMAPTHRLDVRVLGRLEVQRDGVPVVAPELRRERVRQLLAYLLTHDRPTRAAITAELWPDLDEAAAGKNLRVTLAYLNNLLEPERGDLEPPYFVRSAHGCLQFVADEAIEIDSRRFEEQLDEAARLERQGVPSAALTAYLDACELWRGDFFADVSADDWLQWERDRLRGRFVAAAVRAGNLLLARGDPDPAGRLAERALVADPLAEPAYQLLISVALAVGDLVRADRELRRCQRALHELGAPAQQRTVALARQLRAAQ